MKQIIPNNTPAEPAAEVSVLGAVMIANEALDLLIPIIRPEHFSDARHRKLFDVMLSMHGERSVIDLVTLKAELARRGLTDGLGDIDGLMRMIEDTPAAANCEHYARIVRRAATARSLIVAGESVSALGRSGKAEDEMVEESVRTVFDVAERVISSESPDFGELLAAALTQVQERASGEHRLMGLETGFWDLDDMLCGLQDGEMIVLAARPSMGKTSLALNIARFLAVERQTPVGVFSLEMSGQQLAMNLLGMQAQVDTYKLRHGRVDQIDLEALGKANGKLQAAPIQVDDCAGLTPLELRAKARRMVSQAGVKLVIVDYLQLMHAPGHESRQTEVSYISRSLKALARELRLPILAVAQLNRSVEDRIGNRPRLSDLRESGAIEQDADVVMFLHRPGYYQKDTDSGEAELIVAKQRNGPTGDLKLTFRKQFMRFENSVQI